MLNHLLAWPGRRAVVLQEAPWLGSRLHVCKLMYSILALLSLLETFFVNCMPSTGDDEVHAVPNCVHPRV